MADPRFPIRLLALDLDGTLVEDDLVLRPRIRAAIREAIEGGVRVVIATGRMATSAQPFALELGLTDPIIGYQGALVRAMPGAGSAGGGRSGAGGGGGAAGAGSAGGGGGAAGAPRGGAADGVGGASGASRGGGIGRLMYHRPLAAAVARDTIRWTREQGFAPHINHLERFIMPAGDPRTDDYSTFLGARAEVVPDLERWVRHPVSKVLAVGEDGRPIEVLAAARARFAGLAEVTVSHPEFLEFLAPGVSKGRAVRNLARRFGIAMEQTLAMGDQFNDFEMIAMAGHGVAMPSAPAAVQAAARYVAPPLEDEGAAEVIRALVLGGRDSARNVGSLRPGGAAR